MKLSQLSLLALGLSLLLPPSAGSAAPATPVMPSSLMSLTAATPTEPSPTEILDALWTALKDHYPMMEYMGAHDDAWLHEFRPKVAAAPTPAAAYDLLDELVCRLNDYHTRFIPPNRVIAAPPVRVEPVLKVRRVKDEGKKGKDAAYGSFRPFRPVPYELPEDSLDTFAFVVTGAAPDAGVNVGDELVSVDGQPLREVLAHFWKHGVGSSRAGKLRSAAWRMLLGDLDKPVRLGVRRRGGRGVRQVEVSRRGDFPPEPVISAREVDGLPVIKIRGWGDDDNLKLVAEFDRLLERYRDRHGILFDVRGNGGGSDEMADEVTGRFLKAPVVSSVSFHRKVPSLDFRRTVEWAQPRGPWRFEGRVTVLTDEGCMSACEHFVSGMAEAGALLAGTPTSGACGWIRPIELPGGARVNVSQTFPLHTAGLPSPLLGIAPHLWTPVTREDVRSGKDAALEAAVRWIKSDDPLPERVHRFGD